MRAENFFLLINEIDEELVLEAEGEADHEVGQPESAKPRSRFPFKGAIAAAACFAALAAGIFMIAKIRINRPVTSDMNDAGYGGSVGTDGIGAISESGETSGAIDSNGAIEAGGTDNAPPEENKPAGTEGVFKVVDPVDSRIGFERVKSFEPDWNLEYYSWVSRWSGELDERLKLLGQTESNEASLKYLEEFFGTDSLPVDEKYKNELKREMNNGQYVCNVSEGAKAYSPVEGRVIAASEGYNGGLGTLVAVEFDNDKIFAVTHLDEVSVEVGDTVSAGQALGVCGHSGRIAVDYPPSFRLITLIKLIKVDVPPEASEPEAYFKEPSPEDIVIDAETGVSYVKNQLLISAFPDADKEAIEQLAAEFGAEIVGYIELTNDYQIEFTKDMTLAELDAASVRIINSTSLISSISVNYVMTTNYDNNPDLDHHVDGFLD